MRHLPAIVTGVTVDTACVDVVMAEPAHEQQVALMVVAALGTKPDVMRVRS
jgi:hypothetical protein